MEYQAITKYVRMSPRKLRLVVDAIKSLSPLAALVYLHDIPRLAAVPLAKVIASALANAKEKNADAKRLRFKVIEVNVGPVMKRMRAVSRGQGHGYKKRMTHVRVVLTEGK